MKFTILACVAATASAFTAPSMTFAVGKKAAPKKAAKPAATKKVAPKKAPVKKAPVKKAPVKKAPVKKAPVKKAPVKKAPVKKAPVKKAPVKRVVKKAAPVKKAVASSGTVPSQALPGEVAPGLLNGSFVGDVGFDPCYLSTKADSLAPYFNGIFNNQVSIDGLTWYREAELMHGRICMIATVGFIAPGAFGTFEGNEWTGADAFSTLNPLENFSAAPSASLFQIFAFMSALEFRRINNIFEAGNGYQAGDSQRWGQGDGRWNPLGLNYTPEQYAEKQLQEIKHARLAMIGFLGVVFQAQASGVSIAEQYAGAFVAPEYYAKAGYFLPEGI